jgi:hypothetical protein
VPLAQTGPWDHLRRELDRARRYGREFALIRIAGADRDRAADLAALLRTSDYVWLHGRATYVLLPEAGRSAAEQLVARLDHAAPSVLADDALELAAFPEDGLTSGALLAAVRGRPIPRLPAGPASVGASNGAAPAVSPRDPNAQLGHRPGHARTHRGAGSAPRVIEPAH